MSKQSNEEILEIFRRELFEEGILNEGDSIGTDDEALLRFLRARKFSLKESKQMFKDCQEWRKSVDGVGIDELYRRIDPFDYPERKAVFDCWPMWFHKTDKQGRALNVHVFGALDLPNLYRQCTPEKHWQTVLVNAESLPREILPATSRKAGKPISTVLVVIDLKGFGLSQFWQMKSLARRSFQISQDYYPETMGQLAIVNAPSSFAFIWSVIKPWLSKETAEKVDILGSNYKDVLLELVDAENLPSILGGKCTCEAEGGCHLSGIGPWKEGRIGWGPMANKQGENVNRNEGVFEVDVRGSVNDATEIVSERHTVPIENGEEMVLKSGAAENPDVTGNAKELKSALPTLSSSHEDNEIGEHTEESDSPRAMEGQSKTPNEKVCIELPADTFIEQLHITNGILEEHSNAKVDGSEVAVAIE